MPSVRPELTAPAYGTDVERKAGGVTNIVLDYLLQISVRPTNTATVVAIAQPEDPQTLILRSIHEDDFLDLASAQLVMSPLSLPAGINDIVEIERRKRKCLQLKKHLREFFVNMAREKITNNAICALAVILERRSLLIAFGTEKTQLLQKRSYKKHIDDTLKLLGSTHDRTNEAFADNIFRVVNIRQAASATMLRYCGQESEASKTLICSDRFSQVVTELKDTFLRELQWRLIDVNEVCESMEKQLKLQKTDILPGVNDATSRNKSYWAILDKHHLVAWRYPPSMVPRSDEESKQIECQFATGADCVKAGDDTAVGQSTNLQETSASLGESEPMEDINDRGTELVQTQALASHAQPSQTGMLSFSANLSYELPASNSVSNEPDHEDQGTAMDIDIQDNQGNSSLEDDKENINMSDAPEQAIEPQEEDSSGRDWMMTESGHLSNVHNSLIPIQSQPTVNGLMNAVPQWTSVLSSSPASQQPAQSQSSQTRDVDMGLESDSGEVCAESQENKAREPQSSGAPQLAASAAQRQAVELGDPAPNSEQAHQTQDPDGSEEGADTSANHSAPESQAPTTEDSNLGSDATSSTETPPEKGLDRSAGITIVKKVLCELADRQVKFNCRSEFMIPASKVENVIDWLMWQYRKYRGLPFGWRDLEAALTQTVKEIDDDRFEIEAWNGKVYQALATLYATNVHPLPSEHNYVMYHVRQEKVENCFHAITKANCELGSLGMVQFMGFDEIGALAQRWEIKALNYGVSSFEYKRGYELRDPVKAWGDRTKLKQYDAQKQLQHKRENLVAVTGVQLPLMNPPKKRMAESDGQNGGKRRRD